MTDVSRAVFLVDPESDPVAVRIEGRASFQNSGSLEQFCKDRLGEGRVRFVMDFAGCTSMDSTFLGVLAGLAIQLRRRTPAGSLVLARLNARNLELVRNLGLHRLVTIDEGAPTDAAAGAANPLAEKARSEIESARLVLAAHENLVAADETNRARFADVVAMVRQRLDQG
jgi:anti-anti-sigma factor